MLNIEPATAWSDATNKWIRIHDILQFTKISYDVTYAENSRETFRKQVMYHFRNAALIEEMTKNVKSGKIYVTAFRDVKTFKKFAEELAWETEVWLSDMPDHMIHLNGDKFMGPPN